MEVFNPALWYERPDGAWVAVVSGSPGYDPSWLELQPVVLGGLVYLVKRVVVPEVDNPQPGMFGLLVGNPVVTG